MVAATAKSNRITLVTPHGPTMRPPTTAEVTEYAQTAVRINQLEKRKTELGEIIRPWVEAGRPLPKDGPYLLQVSYQTNPPKYSAIIDAMLSAVGRTTQRLLTGILTQMLTDRGQSMRLTPKPNPDYLNTGV